MSTLFAIALVAAMGGTAPDPAVGLWTNPNDTLQVRTRRCGERLCATVVSASARKQAKAKAAGVPALIGTELFSDYRPTTGGDWAGMLYVPDRGRHVSSRVETDGGRSLKVSGCLIGRLLCKSQVWMRADGALARR